MGLIVCATGNGVQSRSVQNAAVELARAQKERLIFLHVVDLRQMGELEEALRPAARAELAWLGEASLRLAQDRARRRGVQAESKVLHGGVCETLEDYLRSHAVDLLLMGAATNDEISQFARRVQEELGVAVQFVAAEA
jgi:nucleotide-binding universal stress UspA family protein